MQMRKYFCRGIALTVTIVILRATCEAMRVAGHTHLDANEATKVDPLCSHASVKLKETMRDESACVTERCLCIEELRSPTRKNRDDCIVFFLTLPLRKTILSLVASRT